MDLFKFPIKILAIRMLSVLLLITSGLFAQINVPGGGAGPAPGGGFNYRPLGCFWGYDRSEMQYTSTELTAAGVPNGIIITRVAFFLNTMVNPANTPVQIYLKEVGGPAGLSVNTYANTITAATLCYSGLLSSASLISNNWIGFNLTSPFLFTGGGTHLEVIVETNYGGSGGENFNDKVFARSNTGTNNYQYWFNDNTPPLGNGFLSTTRPDLQINYNIATPCSTVPGALTTAANPATVCPLKPFILNINGLYPPYNSGYTFQWQSGPSNLGPWTSIAGATAAIYVHPGQAASTWYRCVVNCGAASNPTAPLQVTMNSVISCYCSSTAQFTFDTDIGNVTFSTINNPAVVGPVTNNPASFNLYTNYTSSVPAANITQGLTYPISLSQITSGNFFFAAYFNVFIDWNQDGNFDPNSERAFSGGPTGPTGTAPTVTTVNGNITVPFSSVLGNTRMRVVLREAGNNTNSPCGTYTWGETEDYLLNIVPGTPCNLISAGGASSTLSNVCPTQVFSLNTPNIVSQGSGMQWQWESSTVSAAGPWTAIPGATYIPFSTSQAATTWYRCRIQCGATVQWTTAVQVTLNSVTQCYCTPVHIVNCNNMWIASVNFNTLNNVTGCSSLNGLAYNQYPATGATTTSVTQNQTYTIGVNTQGPIRAIISVWIDYNYNGVYEPSEWQQITVNNPPGNTATIPITIPGTSGTGLTGMRVRARFIGNQNFAPDACTIFGSGETEDYYITIIPFIPPPCAGTPGPFTALSSATNICSGASVIFNLGPNASSVFTGLTYQWESGPTAAGPWTPIAGATTKAFTTTVTSTAWYHCISLCGNSGLISTSTAIQENVQPTTWLGFTNDWADPTNWCGRVPTLIDDVQISLAASGRPLAQYVFPVVATGDTMLAKNITIASTDSITILSDTLVKMQIAQNVLNSGKMNFSAIAADTVSFSFGTTTSGLLQIFKGASATDNIVQTIYTASELTAAGLLPNDIIDSLLFRIYSALSTGFYQNFTISYALLPSTQDQFLVIDPLLGLTPVYTNANLLVKTPSNAVWTPTSAVSPFPGWLRVPVSGMRWDGVSNILLQICYNMTAGSPGGSDLMYLSSTSPRKSCLWLGSNSIATDGCALTSSSPGLQNSFGLVPSTLRPNITFRFHRPQIKMTGIIGGNLNNTINASIWKSFVNLTVNGDYLNNGNIRIDSSEVTINGNFTNNVSVDLSWSPLALNRRSTIDFNGLNWTNNGTFTPGKSRVSFSGALNQFLNGSNSSNFNVLQLNKSAIAQTVTQQKDVSVNDSLVINSGQWLMNKYPITILNSINTNAVFRSSTNGFIISEDSLSKIIWNIGTITGVRNIPFGNAAIASPIYIPFSFQHNSGDLGTFTLATYNAPGNLPATYPPTVTQLNNTGGTNNAANTVDRYWIISKTGANPVTTISFRYTAAERPVSMNIANPGRAQPWRVNGSLSGWLRLFSPFTTLTYTQTYGPGATDVVTLNNFDWPAVPALVGNNNPWAIATNSQPLPVELLNFDASLKNEDQVYIHWATASETDNDFFTVERTLDLNEHSVIAKVPSQGTATDIQKYFTWDDHPAKGVNYYRLRQTDLDGREEVVSPYVAVRVGGQSVFEILYLVNGENLDIYFDYNSNEPVDFYLIDMTGRIVTQTLGLNANEGINILTLQSSLLSHGMYVIQLKNNNKVVAHKFVR